MNTPLLKTLYQQPTGISREDNLMFFLRVFIIGQSRGNIRTPSVEAESAAHFFRYFHGSLSERYQGNTLFELSLVHSSIETSVNF